jgi:hypothetical protein
MAPTTGLPNEFPEGGEGGGIYRPRPFPEIAELPPFEQRQLGAVILQEVLRLRDRLNALENQFLFGAVAGGQMRTAFMRYNPAEFPEGEGGGGGTVYRPPGVQEFPAGPPWEIFARELAQLREQIVELSGTVQQLRQS